jgi:hypothetical protein
MSRIGPTQRDCPPIAWTSLLEAFAAAELTTDLPDCDDEDECVLDPSWL